ncbi:hypothetical protein GHO40_26620 [Pseudomonas helleri]|uniref:DUF2063 domain-containing protein n=1 Tax=Pseudomonas helleri TaxID=1608996 RepID=A0A0J6L532_9PSED|nr:MULTISPECIES: hypothetical protein [Pseudomonas]KMN09586.1 hypothetical protein TU84_09810 [Pseudomonas helleri]MQT32970.1 hypothetical protein [Pseudomonas helleri]MQT50248.1 hypothetical protein [Pseudomonas helleri]MQT60951.1 hypothetical protein [Pseudomonas sp. FSL R10-0399]MQT88184.1 hypothetical protein [Pseudomonas helleri]
MDAEQVWTLWRRLLRDETMQQQMYQAEGATQWLDGLSDDERVIMLTYASQFENVKWLVENYQFRLINSFINALDTGAPLTLRALLNIGLDLPTLSKEFLRKHAWFDYGPKVYGYCDAVLCYLLEHPKLSDYPEIHDLMRLEREGVRLYTGLVQARALIPEQYQRADSARVYQSRYTLSHWLRDKHHLGISSLEESSQCILVYLPSPEARHKFTLICTRSANLYKCLGRPQSLATLARLTGSASSEHPSDEDMTLLRKLHQFNAIWIPV